MPAAYAIAHLRTPRINDDVLEYLERIQATLDPYEGRFLVHGASPDVIEGTWPGTVVVVRFPGPDAAHAWYESPAYQEILHLRTDHIDGSAIIVAGVDDGYDPATTAAALPRRAIREPVQTDTFGRMPSGAPAGGDRSGATPFDALGVLASQDVTVAAGLRHVELYTMGGLVTLLWHEPTAADDRQRAALVMCGGAMGGLLGPADGLYHRLGVTWAARGVPALRVSYRRPGDLDDCCLDVAATVQLAVGAGAERVVVMGHSFGGAVAVRVGVGLDPLVAGVVTFATQSAGCELAGELHGKPLLLFHGERDEILPVEASEMVRMIAGAGELVRLPGDGHLLAKSADILWERLEAWLPQTLAPAPP